MTTHLSALLLAVCFFAEPALAQQPSAKANAPRIARLIDTLDSPRYAERERASRELLALEAAVVAPLHQALATGRSVEFTRRARTLLAALAIYEPGGAIVNGLKVRLSADRTTVKPGDTVKLTTTLCNMTDKPLNVRVGYTTCGNYFECGSALRRANSDTDVEPKILIGGFCGTGAGPMYVTIAPKRIHTFETPVTVAPQDPFYILGKDKYFGIQGTRGIDSIRMVLAVGPTENEPRPKQPNRKGEGIRPTNEDAPCWDGAIRSNDVQLKFAP